MTSSSLFGWDRLGAMATFQACLAGMAGLCHRPNDKPCRPTRALARGSPCPKASAEGFTALTLKGPYNFLLSSWCSTNWKQKMLNQIVPRRLAPTDAATVGVVCGCDAAKNFCRAVRCRLLPATAKIAEASYSLSRNARPADESLETAGTVLAASEACAGFCPVL